MTLTPAEPATDAEGRPRLKNIFPPGIRGTRVSKADVDPKKWAAAKNTLERLKLELLNALDDADANTRHSAIKGLRRWDGQRLSQEPPGGPLWKDRRAAARILAASRDPDSRVRWVVAWMIPKEAGAEGERTLVRLLSDPHRETRKVAAFVLRRRGREDLVKPPSDKPPTDPPPTRSTIPQPPAGRRRRVDDQEKATPTTQRGAEAAGAKGDDQTPAAGVAWGEAAGGLQCRLLMLTPTVKLHRPTWREQHVFVVYELRNVSDKPIRLLPAATPLWRLFSTDFRVLRADGKAAPYVGLHRTPAPIGPEKFLVVGAGKTLSTRVGLPYDFSSPGAYSVSTSKRAGTRELKWFYGEDAEKLRENPARVWTGTLTSNTVTVSVDPPPGATTTQERKGKASVTSSESTVEAAGARPGDQTPAGEAAWGEAVEGVQVRLRAKQSKWDQGTVPRLWADIRNQGKRNLLFSPQPNTCGLEVDGRWYRPPMGGGRGRPQPFPPGRRHDSIAVDLHEAWEVDVSELMRAAWETDLKLTPGKHTIRVAFTVLAAENTRGKLVKAVSNPVEIKIVPATPPAKLQAGVSLVSADEPGQTYRWRIERRVPARLVYGIVEGLGRGQPPPERLLASYEGNVEKAATFLTLRLSRKDGKLRMEIADEYAPPDSGGKGSCSDVANWPPGATLVSAWRKHAATATETKYLVLWQGRFVRDAKTLSSMSFIVRLASKDDPIVHIFGKGDQVAASEPLPAVATEGRPAARPVDARGEAVEIEVISAEEIAARARQLKSKGASFKLVLAYRGPKDNPNQSRVKNRYRSIILHTTGVRYRLASGYSSVRISEQQAARIIDHLAAEGFLANARRWTGNSPPQVVGPAYSLKVMGPGKLWLHEVLGWDLKMLGRLKALRKILEGDAAKRTDQLLAALEPQRKQWEAVATWGQAVDGVQVRLRAKQSKWREGTVPRLWADVRNQGKRNLRVTRQPNRCELEVDGRWYRRPLAGGTIASPSPLPPGRQYDSIAVDLSPSWQPAVPRNVRTPWKAGSKTLGKLTPGKHTIRVAFAVTAARKAPGKPFRAVSNPVVIEIVAKNDEKVDATQPGNACVAAVELTVETTSVKPDDQTPAGETAWGEAVEGVQVRLRAKQSKWKQGTVPRLWADVHNQGKRNLSVTTQSNRCELQVDGRWYRRPLYTRELRMRPRPFPPGRQYDDIAVGVDPWWEIPVPRGGRPPWKAGPERLKLTPGQHTIRVALTATAPRSAPGKSVRAISNPVVIEIVAKSDEKVGATPKGSAGVTAAEPTVETTRVKPDAQTPPAEAAWGQAVEGVQARLRAKQSKWNEGTVPRLWADVRNQGKRNLFIRTQFNRCELEVDGQWYRGPLPGGRLLRLQPFAPDRQYDNIGVDLHGSWEFAGSRSARTPWGSGRQRVKFTPGRHTIRVAFTAMASMKPMAGKNAPGTAVRAVSNPVEIEIVAKSDEKVGATQQGKAGVTAAEPTVGTTGVKPDNQAPAGEAAWGEAVEGVQVRLRAKQSKWKQGTAVRLLADVRNQGKRNLFVRTRHYGCQLEVDGQWYRRPVYRGTIGPPQPLPPGRRHDNIAVDLRRSWLLAAPRNARAPWATNPARLTLTPGKHTIRVAFLVTAAGKPPGKSFRAVSNPVVIEIVPKNDEKVDATPEPKASVPAAEPTVETTGVKPDDQTPAAEAAWGEAVEGVQIRLRAKQSKWNEGTVPRLWADVRNQGERNLLVRTRDHGCQLEVDGRWYRQPVYLGTIPPPRPLPPGRQYDSIAIGLGRSWLFAAPQNARAPWKAGPQPLGTLTPGKHTIRVAFLVTAAKSAPGKPFRAVSNPVEIMILPSAPEPETPDVAADDENAIAALWQLGPAGAELTLDDQGRITGISFFPTWVADAKLAPWSEWIA